MCLGFARYVLTLVCCQSYRREPWETRMTTGAAFAVLALPVAEVLNCGGACRFPSFTFTRTSQDLQMATLLQKRVKSQFLSKSEEHGGERRSPRCPLLMDRRTEISPVAVWAGGQRQAGPNIWHNHKEKLPRGTRARGQGRVALEVPVAEVGDGEQELWGGGGGGVQMYRNRSRLRTEKGPCVHPSKTRHGGATSGREFPHRIRMPQVVAFSHMRKRKSQGKWFCQRGG